MNTMPLPRRSAPPGLRVVQHLPTEHLDDLRNETRSALIDAGLHEKLRPGDRIAITASSRGEGGALEMLRGIADAVREAGGQPFLIPAMGSHGGATPAGQLEILRRLGITDDAVGCPIRATMDTLELGPAANGAVAHLDRFAAEAEGIIVLARVNVHPEYSGDLSAGLLKMCTIGLGKQRGAQQAHSHGLWESVRAVPEVTLAHAGDHARVLFGVAVVENGHQQPLHLEAVPASYDAFLEADTRLLKLARAHVPILPFPELDVLVIDEIGKNISGTGMDLNVIGRWRVSNGPRIPDYRRIVVLSLTPEALGNGLGIGLADFTTQRLARAFDPDMTWVNLLTATEPDALNPREGQLPLALPSDREAIEVALYSCLARGEPRLCRIRNTDALAEFWVSEALIDDVKQNPRLSIAGQLEPLPWDEAGNLLPGGPP